MKRITPSNAIPRMAEAGWIVTVKREDGDLWLWATAVRSSETHSVAAPTDYETVIVALAETVLAGREVRR